MNIYRDSKTDLRLRCDYCIKFQLFEGAQDVFSGLTAVCCMLLHKKPYRLPRHYTRCICRPSCSCQHRFLWMSPIFEHQFCLKYTGTVTTYQVNNFCSLHRSVLIFQPAVNCRASDKQRQAVFRTALLELRSCYVLTYKSGFLEGFRRLR
jgi:hypothetical protein